MTKYIVIASGKGGVGKTTVAVNLATALAKIGKNTILVEGNISTPNVGLHLGATNVPISINEVLDEKHHISSAAYVHASGLKVIPANVSNKKRSAENIANLISDLDGFVDIVIIDSGGNVSKETEHLLENASEVLVVTTPELPAVTDTLRTIKMAESHSVHVSGIVLNRTTYDKYDLSDENIESMLSKPILVKIPEDKIIRAALHQKHPIVHSHPNSPSSKEFIRLAHILLGRKYEDFIFEEVQKKSMYNKLMNMLGFSK